MTPHQTIVVGIRIFAIWLVLNAVNPMFFSLFEIARNTSASALSLTFLLSPVVSILAGLAFWCFPQAIAGKLFPHEGDAAVHDSNAALADAWLAVGCALIGVWAVVTSLPSLVQDIVAWPSVHLPVFGIYEIVRFLLGVCLILGASRLRTIVRRAQYAGIRRSDGPDRSP